MARGQADTQAVQLLPSPGGTRPAGVASDLMPGERDAAPPSDPLTGLAGRSLFFDRTAEALRHAASGGGGTAVLLLDVDRFKNVNDAYGHTVGDELLAALAARLHGAVGSADTLARLGADQIAVLCDGIQTERDALAAAQRLADALQAPFGLADRRLHLTASIGVVIADPAVHTAHALVRDAEVAIGRAKTQGSGRIVLFDESMRRRLLERVGLENDLCEALDQDQFVLFYQPIVSLEERRIVAVEALVRWQHPRLGLVPPSAFLPIAEESGLIVPLGRWVMTEACRQLVRWSADPAIDLPLMSVNVAGRQLAEPELPEEVADVLRRTGVEPQRLALELTESVLMTGTSSPTAVLQRLEALGVPLLLDDFGTGYSSLAHLKRFPIAGVKVDRSFIGGIAEEEQDRHILSAILRMAEGMGHDVVAEGVETVEQAQVLRGLGCTMVQGYLFSAPTPGGAMEVLLRDGLPLSRMPAAFSHPAAATTPPAPPTPDPEGPLPSADSVPTVTLGEAAEALSVSVSTLRRWADAGRIAAVRTAGGHRRFPVSEVRRLNQESALAMRPIVRAVALDGRPLPALAGVLEAIGPQARDRAVLAVYETGRLGWFVSDAGSLQLGRFERALAGAARSADWPAAIECSRELLLHAHYAGASLLERHTLLERYADLTCRLLADRDAERPEIVSTRRLFARLRQALLSDPGGV